MIDNTAIDRKTFQHHLAYMALKAPLMGLTNQMATFIAVKSLGASEEMAILISFAMPIGNLLAFFWSRPIARSRRIPFAFWPDVIGALLLLPLAFLNDPRWFILLVSLVIILRTMTNLALSGIIRDNYPAGTRATYFGRVQAANLGSMAVAGFAAGWALEVNTQAYRWLFPLVAVLALLGCWNLSRIPESDPAERKFAREPSIWDFFRILARDGDFLRYQISFFIFGFASLMQLALLPLYLAQDLKVNYQQGAAALIVITSALPVVMSPIWGWILDRYNMLLLRGFFNIAWALCPFLIFFTDSITGVMIGQVIAGLVQGGSSLVWQLGVNIFARQEEVPIYMGIHQTLTGIRGVLAPITGLWVAKTMTQPGSDVPNYLILFLFSGIAMLAAGIFMVWESQHMKKKGRATTFSGAEKVTP